MSIRLRTVQSRDRASGCASENYQVKTTDVMLQVGCPRVESERKRKTSKPTHPPTISSFFLLELAALTLLHSHSPGLHTHHPQKSGSPGMGGGTVGNLCFEEVCQDPFC